MFEEEIEARMRKILQMLGRAYSKPGDLSVNELADLSGLSRVTVAKHLQTLRAQGKVEVSRKLGHNVLYRITEGGHLEKEKGDDAR